jgi:hypothetical protein
MTSDQFVAWIERRLTEHGIEKVIPAQDTLAQAYRRAVQTKAVNEELARLHESMTRHAIEIPSDLQAQVHHLLERSPELSWDAALWALVNDERPPWMTSDDERCWVAHPPPHAAATGGRRGHARGGGGRHAARRLRSSTPDIGMGP